MDPTFGLPSAGELIMVGIEEIQSAVTNYKRVALSIERGRKWKMRSRHSALSATARRPQPTSNRLPAGFPRHLAVRPARGLEAEARFASACSGQKVRQHCGVYGE